MLVKQLHFISEHNHTHLYKMLKNKIISQHVKDKTIYLLLVRFRHLSGLTEQLGLLDGEWINYLALLEV